MKLFRQRSQQQPSSWPAGLAFAISCISKKRSYFQSIAWLAVTVMVMSLWLAFMNQELVRFMDPAETPTANQTALATAATEPTSIVDIVDSNEGIDDVAWSRLRVAVYMTTHLDDVHYNFLTRCWPYATTRLRLLQDADLILYTSKDPPMEVIQQLNFSNITIKRYEQIEFPTAFEGKDETKQRGAKHAMVDPWKEPGPSWFDGYDWVLRLNPDVLIRRETWLRQTLLNPNVDLLAINCSHWREGPRLNTDFYAFRPQAVNVDALFDEFMERRTAEQHLAAAFSNMIESGRYLPIQHAIHSHQRMAGLLSPVVHVHSLVEHCPDYFNATDGKLY